MSTRDVLALGHATMLWATSAQAASHAEVDPKEFDPYTPLTDQYVAVLPPFGLFYHRVDHLQVHGALRLLPEEAQRRGYLRDPVSLPPRSVVDLEEEMKTGKRDISPYYANILRNRIEELSNIPPPGADVVPLAAPRGRNASPTRAGAAAARAANQGGQLGR